VDQLHCRCGTISIPNFNKVSEVNNLNTKKIDPKHMEQVISMNWFRGKWFEELQH